MNLHEIPLPALVKCFGKCLLIQDYIKLLVNAFLCKKWIHLLTRFLKVPRHDQGGSFETRAVLICTEKSDFEVYLPEA